MRSLQYGEGEAVGSDCFASAMFKWRSIGEDSKIILKMATRTKCRLLLDAKVRKMQTLSLRGNMITAMQSSLKLRA